MKMRAHNGGSIILFEPLDDEAKAYPLETAPDDAQFLGDSLAVEHRYAHDVCEHFISHGIEVV